MKKEDFAGLVVYLLIFGVAAIYVFTILKEFGNHSGMTMGILFLFIISATIVGIVLNAIIIELGHIIGAKLGGYKILSINILGFCFYKKDNKTKFKFSSFDGFTGETKITPRQDLSRSPNPSLYLSLSSILFLIEFIVGIVLFSYLNTQASGDFSSNYSKAAYFILTSSVVGLMAFIYNVVPFKLDSTNDGYRLRLIANPKNKEAFNELLRVENAIANGEDNVEIKTFETITNFTADLNLNKAYVLLDNNKFDEALPYIESIIANKDNISTKLYISTKAQKIYIDIMTKSIEEAQKYYDEEVPVNERRLISEDHSMPGIRAYILMSGILDKSLSETELALNKVAKAYKRTAKNRQPVEAKLYNAALKRVIEAHPNWNLEGYLLTEDK